MGVWGTCPDLSGDYLPPRCLSGGASPRMPFRGPGACPRRGPGQRPDKSGQAPLPFTGGGASTSRGELRAFPFFL